MTDISIVTPTYNRSHTLGKLFDSMADQEGVSFEWIVIDDGSSDETEAVVTEFAQAASFPIRYFKQRNQGRHVALNLGITKVRGQFTMLMDSDDWLAPHGLQYLIDNWTGIPAASKEEFSGVVGLCAQEDGTVIGDVFPRQIWDSDYLTMRSWNAVRGDKKELIRSDILRRFPFPEIAGERRAPTSLMLFRIATDYKMRFINEVVAYKAYGPDGMSANIDAIRMRSPQTSLLGYAEIVQSNRRLPIRFLLRNYINYVRYTMHAGYGLRRAHAEAQSNFIFCLAILPGLALYIRDRRIRSV